jgi:hypothetical protein
MELGKLPAAAPPLHNPAGTTAAERRELLRLFRDHGWELERVRAGARRGGETELRSAVLALVELKVRLRLGLGGVEDRLWSGGDGRGAELTVARQR